MRTLTLAAGIALAAALIVGLIYMVRRRNSAGATDRPGRGMKMELQVLYGSTVALFATFVVSVALAYLTPESVDIRFFVSTDVFGVIRPLGLEITAWNSAAGVIYTSMGLMLAFGCIGAALSRTMLGAGMTRRRIFAKLSTLGLVFTLTYTALGALVWWLASLIERPELTGVRPATLAVIPAVMLLAYVGGLFGAALFVRFAWWVVIVGSVVVYTVAMLVTYFLQMIPALESLPALNVGPSGAAPMVLAVALALWGLTWLLLRALPMRRG